MNTDVGDVSDFAVLNGHSSYEGKCMTPDVGSSQENVEFKPQSKAKRSVIIALLVLLVLIIIIIAICVVFKTDPEEIKKMEPKKKEETKPVQPEEVTEVSFVLSGTRCKRDIKVDIKTKTQVFDFSSFEPINTSGVPLAGCESLCASYPNC